MCNKSKNLYRLFLNNNVRVAGDDSRWTIVLPNWIPVNRECFVWIETCQVQLKVNGGIHITDDCIMLNSNLQSNRIYSQNYSAIGTQLAQLNLPILDGHNGADDYLKLDNPTTAVYVTSLPNSLDFWLSNDENNDQLTITNGSVNFVLVIDFLDNEN